jgi:amidohydrolase
MLKEKIQKLAEQFQDEFIQIRRYLHSHPELSFKEHETSFFILSWLQNLGLEPVKMADTGVVVTIEGAKKGAKSQSRTIALRADIDALPLNEMNNIPYKSRTENVMHACGHDAHTASLLGAAKILTEIRDEFSGTVKLIFQPAEEKLPGGAITMIEQGVLENPKPRSIFAQHVIPEIPTGKVGFKSGKYMASTDEIYIRITGKGGHAAIPWNVVDPVIIASHLIIGLQQIVSRYAKSTMPTVLSFGKVIANGSTNIIPDDVFIEGTFRTFDEDWRSEAHKKIKSITNNLVKSFGGKAKIEIRKGYPNLVNNPKLTEKARSYAVEYLGAENVLDLDMRMTAEDFSYFSHEIPACFYRLGTGNEAKGTTYPLHNSSFNVDEEALKTGMGFMAYLAVKSLE